MVWANGRKLNISKQPFIVVLYNTAVYVLYYCTSTYSIYNVFYTIIV